jgi:hypothetical protein
MKNARKSFNLMNAARISVFGELDPFPTLEVIPLMQDILDTAPATISNETVQDIERPPTHLYNA